MVTVKIENAYSDGHESQHEVLVPPPHGNGPSLEWWENHVYPHTGDGHGIGRDLGSCYVATIIACDDPAMLGKTHEWCD